MKRETISKYAAKETRLRLKSFSKALTRAAKQPEAPEAIHDLRVSIRRVAQAFRTFRDLIQPAPVKKLRRRFHKLMDLCAAVRNCDVALTLLRRIGITAGESVVQLQKNRREAGDKLHRRIKKEHRKAHPAPGVQSRPKKRDWKVKQSPAENLGRVLPAQVEQFFNAGKAAISADASHQTLHQFRLRAKRFRYTLELFERFYGAEMQRGAKILKELQDRLGDINDCAVTIDLLAQDRRAVAALNRLLRHRTSALQTYARGQFGPPNLDWWKGWLARPVAPSS